jgi:hypothetical protein
MRDIASAKLEARGAWVIFGSKQLLGGLVIPNFCD